MKRRASPSEDFQIRSLIELEHFCKQFSEQLTENSVVLLSGPLGAGKTKLVEAILKNLNYTGVSSPTFTLHQSYATQKINVEHFDFYRMQNPDEIEAAGFWDILAQPRVWVFIEWPDKLNLEHLPSHFSIFDLSIRLNGDVRTLTLKTYAA